MTFVKIRNSTGIPEFLRCEFRAHRVDDRLPYRKAVALHALHDALEVVTCEGPITVGHPRGGLLHLRDAERSGNLLRGCDQQSGDCTDTSAARGRRRVVTDGTKKPNRDGEAFLDFNTAVLTADAFLRHAGAYTRAVRATPRGQQMRGGVALAGEQMASATMLALALELYFKGLLLAASRPVPQTHDLVKLFLEIPAPLRAAVVSQYNSLPVPTSGPLGLVIGLSTRAPGAPPTPVEQLSYPTDHSIESVLARSRHAFVTWRYFFEAPRMGRTMWHYYEFESLESICGIVRAEIVKLNGARGAVP